MKSAHIFVKKWIFIKKKILFSMKMARGRPKSSALLTEAVMASAMESGHLAFPPFSLRVELSLHPDLDYDGILYAQWKPHGRELAFVFEIKNNWTELGLQRFAERGRVWQKDRPELRPMVILPYLSETHLVRVQKYGLNALDMCGNGLLYDPPQVFVLRMGGKNRFPTTSATPSIYQSQNLSTLVPRVFLSEPKFPGVQAVLDACRARMMHPIADPPPLSLPTVSRALTQLEHDLVIVRQQQVVRLVEPARLLEGLERSFQAPIVTSGLLGKTELQDAARRAALSRLRSSVRMVTTGRGSAAHYTGLAGPERLQLYVSDLPRVREALGVRETVAFPNVELLETAEEAVYFDAREESGVPWASPVQSYLELHRASARERDVASILRTRLLDGVASGQR